MTRSHILALVSLLAVACGKRDEGGAAGPKTTARVAAVDQADDNDPLVLFEQFVADANAHDPGAVMDHFASNARYEIIGDPVGPANGRAAIRNIFSKSYEVWAPVIYPTRVLVHTSGLIVAQVVLLGTDPRPPPIGDKPIGMPGLMVFRIANGEITSLETFANQSNMLAQLGLGIPGQVRPPPEVPEGDSEVLEEPGDPFNIEVLERQFVGLARHDWTVFERTCAPDVEAIDHAAGTTITGTVALAARFTDLVRVFPDWQPTLDQSFAIGDYVFAKISTTGTHKGALGPLPPTHRSLSLHSAFLLRFVDGNIVTMENYNNELELTAQLGLLPKQPAKK
jgi:ketosteroid isomerase-like protein